MERLINRYLYKNYRVHNYDVLVCSGVPTPVHEATNELKDFNG